MWIVLLYGASLWNLSVGNYTMGWFCIAIGGTLAVCDVEEDPSEEKTNG